MKCKVTEKRINRGGGYVLVIPVQYNFFGPKKVVDGAGKGLKKVIGSVEKIIKNCTK